ncbi:MAG TPA: hypothetical protein VKE69_05410, partial [Planctomycetota bacterium]|nr:hypothetical protein [Planctomycetota bacterium]
MAPRKERDRRWAHAGCAAAFAVFLAASLASGKPASLPTTPPFTKLLYVARKLGAPETMRIDLPQATTWGSNLYVRDLASGTSTPLLTASNLPAWVDPSHIDVQSPALRYDAKKVVFSARLAPSDGWNLYELDLASLELHAITGGTPIEDELMPSYLPDGDLVFCSNRHRGYDEYESLFVPQDWVLHNAAVSMYRCQPDGKRIRRLSHNQSHDLSPSVLKDGRILHSSWLKEGEPKRETRFPAWTIRPDGSESFPLFGDHGIFAALLDLAELPDGRIVGVNAFFKSGFGAGSLVVMHPHVDDFEDDYVVITPDVPLIGESPVGRYRSPRPTPDGRLVVSWSETGTWDTAPPQFGLWLMNLDGSGKQLLVDDPNVDEVEGIPLVPYSAIYGVEKPAALPPPRNPTHATTAIEMTLDARFGDFPTRAIRKKASAFSPNDIVAIRVLAGLGNRTLDHTNLLKYEPEVILGEVPLESDGSMRIEVPASIPYHFQGIDSNGIAVVHETAWQFEPPGKSFTCGGCHAHQSGPAPNPNPVAATKPPVKVGKGTPGYREIEFATDVLPILQAKCVSCHRSQGTAVPAGGLDLSTNPYMALHVDKSGVPFGPDTFTYVDEGPVARRYLTPGSANESLFVWKLFGQRLDGRTSSDLSVDVDYSGQPMPPPASGIALTAAERKLLVQWVDAGAQESLGIAKAATLPDSDGDGIPDAYFVSE